MPMLCFACVLLIQQIMLIKRGGWMNEINEFRNEVNLRTADRIYRSEMNTWLNVVRNQHPEWKLPPLPNDPPVPLSKLNE